MTKIIYTKTSLNFTLGILTMCGIWMPPSYVGTWRANLYGVYTVFFYTGTVILYLLTEFMDIFVNFGDLEKNIETSLLAMTNFAAAVKAMNVIIRRQRIQRIVDKLDEPAFSHVSKESSKHLLKVMTISSVCGKLLLSSALCTILLWGTFPLYDKSDELPLRAWFPWDRSVRSTFVTLYVFQVVSIAIIGSYNCSLDALMCSIMILICGQLDVLYSDISTLGLNKQETGKKIGEINTVARNSHGEATPKAEDIKTQLRRCILHQKEIIDYIKEVESLFGGVIFIQFLVSCIVICVTAFQLSVTPLSMEFASNTVYLFTILGELFLFCYPGNEVMLKSELIYQAAYLTPWYDEDMEFKKMLILVMERSKRPIKVTAGHILPLTLQTLTSILRSSYSYYAILNTILNDD